MKLSRVLLVLAVVAAGWWFWRHSGAVAPPSQAGDRPAPIDRARTAAAASSAHASDSDAAQREADAPVPSGAVSENMTPDQVRALLGPPDETSSDGSDGVERERWIYRRVGKTVVFEKGVVVRVE